MPTRAEPSPIDPHDHRKKTLLRSVLVCNGFNPSIVFTELDTMIQEKERRMPERRQRGPRGKLRRGQLPV